MKLRHLFILPAACALLWPALAGAQVLTPAARDTRNGQVVLSDPQAVDNNVKPDANQPREIRERLARFEQAREEYRREQERLRKALAGAATEKERDRVREQIRAARDAWLDRLKSIREELKDRLPELRRRLPELGEVLDNARNNARDTVNSVRKRRGQD